MIKTQFSEADGAIYIHPVDLIEPIEHDSGTMAQALLQLVCWIHKSKKPTHIGRASWCCQMLSTFKTNRSLQSRAQPESVEKVSDLWRRNWKPCTDCGQVIHAAMKPGADVETRRTVISNANRGRRQV